MSRICMIEALEPRRLLSFGPPTSYAGRSSEVIVGDFNNDGITDVLSSSGGSSNPLFVRLGNGDGSLGTVVPTALSPTPRSIAVADFNGDAKLDLVGAGINGVSVLLGNGNGSFRPTSSFTLPRGQNALLVEAADFNGDGRPDLIVGGFTTRCRHFPRIGTICGVDKSYVNVFLGNGDGSFRAKDTSVGIEANFVDLALADFNRDGRRDVLISGSSGTGVLPGNGDGTLRRAAPFVSVAGNLAVADLNADNNADFVVGAHQPSIGMASVFLGRGDATFQTGAVYTIGRGPTAVAVGDFNRDGKPDLAATESHMFTPGDPPAGVNVLLGNGNGTFASPRKFELDSPSPIAVAAGDLNGDGWDDLVVGTDGSNTNGLWVLINDRNW